MSKARGESKYVKVKESGIHNRGLFAAREIPEGARVIEYVGDKVTKAESSRRADKQLDEAEIRVVGIGRLFVRNVAMVFDEYLRRMESDGPVFSRTV